LTTSLEEEGILGLAKKFARRVNLEAFGGNKEKRQGHLPLPCPLMVRTMVL
jgi:hypothetical protein